MFAVLAAPAAWEIQVRRGEAVVLQAQLAAVAATAPVEVQEVEVSIEPLPTEPPPAPAVEHVPVRNILEPIPIAIPVVRSGEYEPTEAPQVKPPESPTTVEHQTQTPPREVARQETPQLEATAKAPQRQVAEILQESPNKVSVAAAAPAVAGAQVDEMPRKLPNNREPLYPVEALRAGLEGRVVLKVEISAAGRATRIEVKTSSGYARFDESAIAAVRDWEFSPARRQGLAVTHVVLVPVSFHIRRG